MSHTYCHTHSKYDCPTCADEILSLGIQADKDRIKWLESEVARLEACAARTVPEGYVMVPVEPTQEMLKKSGLYDDDTIEVNCAASMAGQIYRAMLAAAPKKEGE